MDIVTTIATVPAVIALVTLAKDLGLPSKAGPLVAVILGIGLSLFSLLLVPTTIDSHAIATAVGTGLILGLSASGLYDGAKAVGGTSSSTTETPSSNTK